MAILRLACGRAWRPNWRGVTRWYARICAVMGVPRSPHAQPIGRTVVSSFADDQLGAMRLLGFDCFHLVGHDRGGRTGHRMALDHPEVGCGSLTVMDIAPTFTLLMNTNRKVAHAYWHWYFLAQPEPFPERLIGADPDYFYETSMVGWGGATIGDFAPDMLAEYRRCWRQPEMIHGSCSDYRAAATIDLDHDSADIDRKVSCPRSAAVRRRRRDGGAR